jgi:hypothetical protein
MTIIKAPFLPLAVSNIGNRTLFRYQETMGVHSRQGQEFFLFATAVSKSRDNSVGLATRLRAGWSGF